MPKREDIKTILIVGSGPIVIGQACEFDYSGTQACKALRENGYRVVLVNSNPATIMTDPEIADATYIEPVDWKTLEQIIIQEKPDAILPTMGGQTGLNVSLDLDLSCLGNIPVIILGNSDAYPSFDSIGNNSRAGVELAFERLHSLKHRRIGLVLGGSSKLETSAWRIKIYRDFHQKHGLMLDENLITQCKFTVRASDAFIMARDPIKRLLKLERRPTAIFASNDILALSVLQVANELGIAVPDELSVIGMDDVFAASTSSPPLTTICKQRYKLGELAAERLLDLLSCPGTVAQKTPLRIRLACKLIERGTTSSL